MKDKTLWISVLIIILAFVGLIVWQRVRPGQHDTFAQCLTDNGVKEYGAYWCPNCQRQKKDFGNSFKKITYIECALPGGKQAGQTAECADAGVKGYPTWVFPDGARLEGYQPLSILAEQSGCSLQPAS
ncbi:MAG: hypothetical protein AAB633_01520 [Patescibacteria group bacterium]